MNLFQNGKFKLNSGQDAAWKIECDSLSCEDWDTLAIMASEILPPFGKVIGVPTGGIRFANALKFYADPESLILLIADDVLTTGNSMRKLKEEMILKNRYENILGIVAFSRGDCPYWISPVFQLSFK